jgi:hypothetical protein
MSNVNVHRTLLNTAAAAHTGHALVVFIREVFELVHETLSDPLQFLVAWVVS